MSLRRRLERLEGGDGRCPECGWPPRPDEIEYIICWPEDPEPEPTPPCPLCGREREIVVDWDDAPTPEEQARMEARMWEHARAHPEVHTLAAPADLPDHPPGGAPGEGDEGGGG